MGEIDDIPEFLVQLYLMRTEDDGPLKEGSKRIPPTVYGFIGQGNLAYICLL